MTEADFYRRYFRPALHNPPHRIVLRVEDYGLPDVLVVDRGDTYFIELKVLDHFPVREGTPFRIKYTVEQKRTAVMLDATRYSEADRPIAFFLAAVARQRRWYLFPSSVPAELRMDELDDWAIESGTFDQLKNKLGG